ncbi:MAG TPA: beta-L-arabinofuranosidase domain-containing protein [Bacillota bacterium]|nr:beta-L-arabinofuranosidase domain-containing protein [Bacillota bacterium]
MARVLGFVLLSVLIITLIGTVFAQQNPVGWYKFDETGGTVGADSSGSGRNATLVNGPTWVAGKLGNAVNLDGSNDYISMPGGMISTLNDFSIATWVKLDAVRTWSRIFDFGTGTGANMFLTPSSSDNTIRFAITTSGSGGEQRINGTAALPSGTWKHVAVALNGNVGILYVDGVEVGRNSSMSLKPSGLGTTGNNYIGRSQYTSDPYLDGQIDDFRMYDRAISAAEVQALFGGTTPTPTGTTIVSPSPTLTPPPAVGTLIRMEPLPGTKINSTFWNARIKNIITTWIPYCYNQLSNVNLAEGSIDNFVQAGRKLQGQSYKAHVGYWFSNAYVHNTVEAMCYALMIDPQGDSTIINAQNAIKTKLEDWIPKILSAQESDGYLHTWTTLGNNQRWTDRAAHEGYTGGYFMEAAIAHYLMTNRTDSRLYNAAKRLADCWCANKPGLGQWWDGHQEMEQAMTRFGVFVNGIEGSGKGDKYINCAKRLLDVRYSGPSGQYDQSHAYPVNQTTAVGHSVRAAYMYAGMADVGSLLNNSSYLNAANTIWDNMINRKMYVTGGLGSGETSEGFGGDYSLPNASAYCESCAGCGNLFFNHNLNLHSHNGKFADIMELALYNNVLGSLNLNANLYTYTNSLDTTASRYSWHGCPCCIGNIPKTILALPKWTYAKSGNAIYVNMYVGSTMTVPGINGATVQMIQTTDYPWSGNVTITVNPSTATNFTIYLHAPDRSVSTCYSSTPGADGISSITVNGSGVSTSASNGYVAINRTWVAGDRIVLTLPLNVQRVKAVGNVAACSGRVALQRGPIIYNIEAVDHNNADVRNLILSPSASLTANWNSGLLGGVWTINGSFTNGAALTAIPNYARLNRGGRSIVWLRDQ